MEVKFAETRANDQATILAKNLQSGPNYIILCTNKKKKRKREISSVVCLENKPRRIFIQFLLFLFLPFLKQESREKERERFFQRIVSFKHLIIVRNETRETWNSFLVVASVVQQIVIHSLWELWTGGDCWIDFERKIFISYVKIYYN